MKRNRLPWLVLIPVLIAGCGTSKPDDLGSQVGTITEIFPVGVVPGDFPDCRVELKPEEVSSGRYMQVHFRSYRLHRSINAFVPLTKDFKKDDKVVVSHPYCIGSHKPEILDLAAE